MNNNQNKLTLDRSASYEIKVPGYIDTEWAEWGGWKAVTSECKDSGLPITIFSGTVDQAGLQGLLHRLYSKGLPLISVKCIDQSQC